MNLILKKGILVLLLAGLVISCDEDDIPNEDMNGTGLTEITLSSFEATSGPDASGVEDGTYITVKPLAIGVTSYDVDFGDGSPVVVIEDQGGSASYDYPNELEEAKYIITVTAKSNEFESVIKTKEVTVEHEIMAVTTAPSSPTKSVADVLSVYSNGIEYNDDFISFKASAVKPDYNNGDAQHGEVTMDSGNKVIQYSRLNDDVEATIEFDEIVVADAFGSGIGATHIHFDVHSDFAVGIDKLKITLVNGGTEHVFNQDLTDGEWIGIDLALADGFSNGGVTQLDEIKFELGAGGTSVDGATLNVDNVYLYKMPSDMILNGDFDLKTAQWSFAKFTGGTTTAFGSSSDGSWTNYDGTDNGSKTKGAKWTSSQSGGPLQSSGSRYAYQALTLTPNTEYILEYEYAIKNDVASDPIGGRRIVGAVLDDHFIDGANAVNALSSNLGNHVGTIAEGKFSGSRGTLVQIPFTSNDSGEVAVLFYAVTPKDAWIDNVKVYPVD